jgi:hypothetical protein
MRLDHIRGKIERMRLQVPPSTRGYSEASTGGHFDGLSRSASRMLDRIDKLCAERDRLKKAGACEGQSVGRSSMVTDGGGHG